MKNIAITGAEGFIGSHLVQTLRQNKNYIISLIDKPAARFHTPSKWKSFVKNKDVVVHLAGINRDTNDMLIAGNAGETFHIMDAIAQTDKHPRIICTSSTQSGNGTPYGFGKRISENILKYYSNYCEIPTTIFRLTNVFGEGCKPFYNSVIATFCYLIANKKTITVNDPTASFKFIYVGDVINKILEEIELNDKSFKLKTITSRTKVSVGELAETLTAFSKGTKTPKTIFEKKLYKTFTYYKTYKL